MSSDGPVSNAALSDERLLAQIDSARVQVRKSRERSADSLRRRDALRPAPPPPDAFPGYQVEKELHRGGQGVVYLATHKATGRKAAIKVMREGPFAGTLDVARFERELRILRQLDHPDIVAIRDSGIAAGSYYHVFDYVAGLPLDLYIERAEPSIREILELFAKTCDAVHAAHLRGVIHRDLKPGNILIDADGSPKILDFGLAQISGDDSSAGNPRAAPEFLTVTGQFLGSLPWASPEQAEGAPAKIDLRTDVYSLGVLLYQMLTGQFPYRVGGNMREALDNIVRTDPTRPSSVRRDLGDEVETMVMKCLAKEPAQRYQTAGELARDLRLYLAGDPIEAKRDNTFYVLRKHLRRHRLPAAVVAAFVLLVAASSIVAWSLYGKARERLWESYLAQARARRATNLAGRRFDSLEALRKAADIRPSMEVRNEALACLTLSDLRVVRTRPATANRRIIAFDDKLQRYAVAHLEHGGMAVHRCSDDAELTRLPDVAGSVWVACFSPDGRYLAAKCEPDVNRELRLIVWDVDRGTTELSVPDGAYDRAICFSSDGSRFAAGRRDGTIQVYDLPSCREALKFSTQPQPGTLRFDSDGRRLATTSLASSNVEIYEVESGDLLRTLTHPDVVRGVAWNAEGTRIAAACADFRVYVWDTVSGAQAAILSGHEAEVGGVVYDRSGEFLASSSWDRTTRLWRPDSGQPLVTVAGGILRQGFLDDAPLIPFDDNAEGRGFWELAAGRECRTLPAHLEVKGPVHGDISPDGRLLASSGDDGVRLLDVSSGRMIQWIDAGMCFAAFFDRSGRALFTVGRRGLLRWPLDHGSSGWSVGSPVSLWASGSVSWADQSADGRTIVFSTPEGRGVVLDSERFQAQRTIDGFPSDGRITISPQAQWIAALDRREACIKVFDVAGGVLLKTLPATGNADAAFSPEGQWLLTSSGAGYSFWRVGSWELSGRVPASSDVLWLRVAFARDGTLAAVMLPNGKVQLVDPNTASSIAILEAPNPAHLTWLCFNRDGSMLAAVGYHAIQLWDLRRIREQLVPMGLDW